MTLQDTLVRLLLSLDHSRRCHVTRCPGRTVFRRTIPFGLIAATVRGRDSVAGLERSSTNVSPLLTPCNTVQLESYVLSCPYSLTLLRPTGLLRPNNVFTL